MSVKIKQNAKIGVTYQGGTYNIPVEDWEASEPVPYPKGEEQMGSDLCHRYTLEGYEPAGAKGVAIDAEIEIWEYPDGSIEAQSVSDGVSEADVKVAFYAEID